MKVTSRFFLFSVVIFIALFTTNGGTSRGEEIRLENPGLVLWYQQPAEKWVQALPVGNGRLGAMIFGKVHRERIQLNEESLWSGCNINSNNPKALKNLPRIRELLLNDQNKEAYELATKTLLGTPPRIRSYQTLGDIFLSFETTKPSSRYKRELCLETGICKISYEVGRRKYVREIFASAPDDIVVIHLTGENGARINTAISLSREKDARIFSKGNHQLIMTGQIIDEPDSLRGPGGAHLKFAAILQARTEGGGLTCEDNKLIVTNAKSLTVLLTAATDYHLTKLNFDRSIVPEAVCQQILSKAIEKSYHELKMRHVKDHQALFNRVELDLGTSELSHLPTDERLNAIRQGKEDDDLIALYFQFGRYLLMGSSRFPGVLPANLQGIWNEHYFAPWGSDYHTNINLQMNYWPAEVCQLPETALPLIDFLNALRVPGRVTAREMYGAGGWTMHHVTDIFGRTSVMDGIHWGMLPMGAAWMTFPVWRHFEFTGDTTYLMKTAYPIMKESAQFVLDFLIEDKNGRLVTAPSYSPENSFRMPGSKDPIQLTYAPTMDIQIINELFNNTIRAGEILRDDPEFREKLQRTLNRLPPIQIGKDGTIQEWIQDYEEVEPGHRHMSHLLGLHPGSQITPETPELFQAAQKTIERRLAHGGGHTGWSRAWIINFFARLRDGEKAYENVLALLRKSTLPNLFDNHPPFQIDGNFGGTAGIAEMLLQSHTGEIVILPALPAVWQQGSVRGLCARGGFILDISWKEGALSEVRLLSTQGNRCHLRYGKKVIELETKQGELYSFFNEDFE